MIAGRYIAPIAACVLAAALTGCDNMNRDNSSSAATPAGGGSGSGAEHGKSVEAMPALTAAEASVIRDKGTERPFTGKYWDFFGEGVYLCRQCGAPLYRSDSKFRSDCGWPVRMAA